MRNTRYGNHGNVQTVCAGRTESVRRCITRTPRQQLLRQCRGRSIEACHAQYHQQLNHTTTTRHADPLWLPDGARVHQGVPRRGRLQLDPRGGIKCLDVAGGTGDIAMRILDHAKDKHFDRKTHVQMLDINPEMLEEGKRQFARTMYHDGPQISFTLGNAEDLSSIESNSQDLYTIAFGIRNCTHVDRVLKEAFRVLKPGGVFSCLEFGKVTNPVLAKVYKEWSFQVIPNLGHIVAGDRDSYQYLVESIERFPPQPEFARMIKEAGFTVPKGKDAWEDLTFGIAAIHTAVKV